MEDVGEYLRLAKDASVSAGKLLIRKYKHVDRIMHKTKADLVTEADLEAEKMIISMIRKRHPDHSFLAEEGGESGERSDYLWVIDPLDGTNNFAYGLPLFGVSIALLKNKEPVLGVINIPSFNQLFQAVKGGGSTMNGKPVRVSRRKRIDEVLMFYDSEFFKKKSEMMASLNSVMEKVFRIRMLGAATIHFTQIALGNADAWAEHTTTPWDISAGCLLIEEAGGKVTDLEGNPWTPWSKNMLVSNGMAHDELLRLIRKSD